MALLPNPFRRSTVVIRPSPVPVVRRGQAPAEQRATTIDLAKWRALMSPNSGAGVVVNEFTALEVATVLAIVRRIATDNAKLGVSVVKRQNDGSTVPDYAHPLYPVLAKRPNEWQTAFEFREMMTAHCVLTGDAVAIKQTVSGRVDQLIPLTPRQVSIRQEAGWRMVYDVHAPAGDVFLSLPAERVFHLRNMSWNGFSGINLSRTSREAIGLSAALAGAQATQMRNGAKPQGILTTEQNLDDEALENIIAGWKSATTAGNAYSTPILDRGLKFAPISMSAVDSQTIETRKHQIIELCAAFGMIPAVLGIDDKTQAYASAEAMLQAYVDQVVWPWAERWQQRLDLDCLDGTGPYEVHFDLAQMRKASAKDQAEADVKLVTNGLRLRNELRQRDGLPPIPGGDEPMLPLNMNAGGNNAA